MNLLSQLFGDTYLKILVCFSYVEGEDTTQPETGMSKIIEEGPACVSKPSPEKKYIRSKVQLKNAFVTGLRQNYIQ